MSPYDQNSVQGMPRPSKPLGIVLVALLAIWILFALGINWGGAPEATFLFLAGDSRAVANGQLFRLFTAPLMHLPTTGAGVQHIAFSLIGIYFLGTALEQIWGTGRLLRFLGATAVLSYLVQWLVVMALPPTWTGRLVQPIWYGSTPVLAALSIAFALSLRNQKVLLFFVLPMGSRALVLATVGISLLLVVADAMGPSGHLAPFAGMFFGWLLGAGTPSPARRLWLRFRMGRLDAEVRRSSARRPARSDRRFEVISGGLDDSKARKRPGTGSRSDGGNGMLH